MIEESHKQLSCVLGKARPLRRGARELREPADALRDGQAEFSRQPTHRVCQHRLLLDQQGSRRMQGQDPLVLHALRWHELHVGPRRRRRRVPPHQQIVLLPLFHERFDCFGRDQLHLVSKPGQYSGPVMCRTARLYDDRTGLLLLEERDKLAPLSMAA